MHMQFNGWMNAYIFNKWMNHFFQIIKKLRGNFFVQRHIMMFNYHTNYITFNIIVKTYEIGLNMDTFTLHISHVFQYIDISCFKPFKTIFKAYRDI